MNVIGDREQIVIVTGSSGLLGTAVIDALRKRVQVVGFDRDGQPQPPPEVECVCVDLTSDRSVQRGLDRVRYAYGHRIAAVVHLAAYYDFSGEPSDLYEKVTVRGTERLLRFLQPFDVDRFIFSSTMLVHKPTEPGEPINEQSPLLPRWDYPKSKVKTEHVIEAQRRRIPAAILRIAGVYTDWCQSIPIAHQIDRIVQRKLTSHVYPGDTSHGQSFVHLDDVVKAIDLTIEHRRMLDDSETLLIGEPETLSYDCLQRHLAQLIHNESDWTTRPIPKAVARTGSWIHNEIPGIEDPFIKPWMIDMADDHYELDIGRARERLGWSPQRHLSDTLPQMVRRLKAEPQRWYERNHLPLPSRLERDAPARPDVAAPFNLD